MVKIGVTPWFSPEEWNHVRELVLSRDKDALAYFRVWNSRVDRLPVGVEATLALMQVKEDPSNEFAISMAINRFINHISHIVMNLYGESRIFTVAKRLGLPEWVVDIRHDAAHGHMPSLYLLRSAYEVCWSWITVNYWQQKKVSVTTSDMTMDHLPDLLDLYLYLKVYQIWGTSSLKKIAAEAEVFSHIEGLWRSCIQQNGNNILNYSMKQAVECVTSEISRLNADPGFLAQVLVQHDLLVPPQDFLQSLSKEGAEEEDCVEVPSILISIFRPYIENIDAKIGAKHLINHLVHKIGDETVEEGIREYCSAWVVELAEAMQGQSANLKLKQEHNCTTTDLEIWLSKPNRLVEMLVPCFCSLAGVGKKKAAIISKLMVASLGSSEINHNKVKLEKERIFTIDDLEAKSPRKENNLDKIANCDDKHTENASKEVEESTKGAVGSGWVRQPAQNWDKGKLFKTSPTQTWDSLWLPETCCWQPASEDLEVDEDNLLLDEVDLIVWPGGGNGGQKRGMEDEDVVPAFYRLQDSRSNTKNTKFGSSTHPKKKQFWGSQTPPRRKKTRKIF